MVVDRGRGGPGNRRRHFGRRRTGTRRTRRRPRDRARHRQGRDLRRLRRRPRRPRHPGHRSARARVRGLHGEAARGHERGPDRRPRRRDPRQVHRARDRRHQCARLQRARRLVPERSREPLHRPEQGPLPRRARVPQEAGPSDSAAGPGEARVQAGGAPAGAPARVVPDVGRRRGRVRGVRRSRDRPALALPAVRPTHQFGAPSDHEHRAPHRRRSLGHPGPRDRFLHAERVRCPPVARHHEGGDRPLLQGQRVDSRRQHGVPLDRHGRRVRR